MYKDQDFRHTLKIAAGLLREQVPETTIPVEDFLNQGFSHLQQKFILDRSKYKDLEGGKRGGKSVVLAGDLVYTDLYIQPEKKGYLIYGSRTAGHAKRLALQRLMQAKNKYNFKWKTQLSQNIIVTERNVIVFAGIKDLKSVWDLQGLPIKWACVDEAQFIKSDVLECFIRDVVAMGLNDFKGDGVCILAGNPAPVEEGYRWDYQKRPTTSQHRINIMDNPSFSNQEVHELLTEELEARGETWENMSNASKRLLLGKKATDKGLLVLKFTDKDFFDQIPPETRNNCDIFIGIDLGYDDKTAVIALYYDWKNDIIYADYEFQETEMTETELAGHLKTEVLPYNNSKGQNVIDTQGGGKQTAAGLRRDHNIPMLAAKKSEKMAWIRKMKAYNKAGKLLIKKGSPLANDAKHVIFTKHYDKLDEEHFHSDIFHAALYAFRHLKMKYERKTTEKKLSPEEELIKRFRYNKELEQKKIEKEEYGLDEETEILLQS